MVKVSFTGFLVILFTVATVINLIMMLVSMIRKNKNRRKNLWK